MESQRRAPTVPEIASRKRSRGGDPVVMVTAYDTPSARIADRAGVDVILVGDSMANVVLGFEDTLQVDVGDMERHTAAVARARPTALVVADMPWLSYHVSEEETVSNAARLVRAGGAAVKLEGGRKRVRMIERIVDTEIPVMGHLGLTPQSVHAMGGFRVQGRGEGAAERLLQDAKAIEGAGCFAIVLEGVPRELGRQVTEAVAVPVIGIGAGPDTDGQVLVFHDLLGLGDPDRKLAKFVRQYAALGDVAVDAVSRYAADVRSGAFPGPDESYD